MGRKYAWAVIDGNIDPGQWIRPWSVHDSYEAAERSADKQNKTSPNEHYYVLEWGAGPKEAMGPNDRHYSCGRWIDHMLRSSGAQRV